MKGFIQVPLLIILLIGTGAGIYLIQQKTHISGKEVLDTLFNQPTATKNATPDFTYQLPTPASAPDNSGGSFLSTFQRLLQRKASQSPTPSPRAAASPAPSAAGLASFPSPSPSAAAGQNNPVKTPAPTPKPKPICSVIVMPSSTGQAPYAASVCVGNNSNPYQAIQKELADFDGNGSWDYQGSFYGCHSFTFQNPGTYSPKAQIIGTSGAESDICQTSATISPANPTPTPTPIFSTAKPVLTVSGPYTNGDSGPCFDLSSKHPYNYTQSADYKFDQNESSYRYTSLRDTGYSAIATVCWVKDPSKTGNQYIFKAKSYVYV